ncbi:MAG: hypothetical protein J7J82_09150 [Staphylothermus sp.]|nr:hypothetical protein [Staphylothermus sp.]
MNKQIKAIIAGIIISALVVSILFIQVFIYDNRANTNYSKLEALLRITYPEITPKYMKYIKIDPGFINQSIQKLSDKYEFYKQTIEENYISQDYSKAYKYLNEAKKTLAKNPYQALIFLRKAQYYLSIIEGYFLIKNNKLNKSILENMIKNAWDKYFIEHRKLFKLIYCGENLSTVIIGSYIIERHISSAKTWLEQAEYYLKTSYWFMDNVVIYAFVNVSLNNILDAEIIYNQSYGSITRNYTIIIMNKYKEYKALVKSIMEKQDFEKTTYAYTIYLEARGYLDQGKQYYKDSYLTHALFYTMYSYVLANTADYFKEYSDPPNGDLIISIEDMIKTKKEINNLLSELREIRKEVIALLLADKVLLDSKRADLLIKYMYDNRKMDQCLLATSYLLYLKSLRALEHILSNRFLQY